MYQSAVFPAWPWGQAEADRLAAVLGRMEAGGYSLGMCLVVARQPGPGLAPARDLWLIFQRTSWALVVWRRLYAIIRPVRRRPETRQTGSLN
jgi:hypothetical protein